PARTPEATASARDIDSLTMGAIIGRIAIRGATTAIGAGVATSGASTSISVSGGAGVSSHFALGFGVVAGSGAGAGLALAAGSAGGGGVCSSWLAKSGSEGAMVIAASTVSSAAPAAHRDGQ